VSLKSRVSYVYQQCIGFVNNSVVPNREDIFSQAESADTAQGEVRRTITMYRSGFTVDNGPYRQLSDPSNSEFLTALARGMVPRELQEGGDGEVMVGLIDKRSEEYDPDRHGAEESSGSGGAAFESFSGEGQSLGVASSQSSGGVIDPTHPNNSLSPPPLDASQPSTSIAIRLPNGKRLVLKVNLSDPVSAIGQHIGDQVDGSYVLTTGFPPATIENLDQSVEEAGLKGAQVGVKKV
jgi:UBX domain-containing protein 1